MSGTGAAAAQLQCLTWSSRRGCRRQELVRVIDLAQTPLPPELTHIPEDFWLIDGREVRRHARRRVR